jgi:molybdopterin converting factor small subunit
MKIKVIYLARLSEDMGKKEEYIEISESESTIKDIYLKLNLDKLNYKIYSAKNFEHSEFDSNIKDNDEVAFFPTITGG